MSLDRVVMFSGGIGSQQAAKRVAAEHGTDRLTLLFTDTRSEDNDLYRFLVQSAARFFEVDVSPALWDAVHDLPEREPEERAPAWASRRKPALTALQGLAVAALPRLAWIAEGRTIWEVFAGERYLGNSRVDPCSKILKRQMADRWLRENRPPVSTVVYDGIDWSEQHRHARLALRRLPWIWEAPMCEAPYLTKPQMLRACREDGIEPPRLYSLGFAHNNCGGGCVKAGIGHFAHLYRALPVVFEEWEENEAALRERLGDVAILRDRTGGTPRPLPLSALRARLESGGEVDQYEIGGCGCFSDVDESPALAGTPGHRASDPPEKMRGEAETVQQSPEEHGAPLARPGASPVLRRTTPVEEALARAGSSSKVEP